VVQLSLTKKRLLVLMNLEKNHILLHLLTPSVLH
jgi:hypothetical protein